MMTIALVVELISTVLSLLCLPINIMFVYVISKESRHQHTPFASSFFRLCIHLSVADILMSIFATIFFKFPIFGVFPESFYGENWSMVPVAGVNYLGHSQAIGIIFIAINRFTAVYCPIRHKQQWWRPQITTILMVLQWTLPLLFIIPLFFTEFTFVMDRSTGSVTFSSKDPIFHKVYFVGLAILDGIVVNTIVSAFYIAIFIRVQTHIHVRKPGELAMRLALSGFIIFISYCTLGIHSDSVQFKIVQNNSPSTLELGELKKWEFEAEFHINQLIRRHQDAAAVASQFSAAVPPRQSVMMGTVSLVLLVFYHFLSRARFYEKAENGFDGIFSVLAAMTRPEDAWMYRTLWFVVNDVLCASNAPILLALNKPIRNVFMKRIGISHEGTHAKGSLMNNM